MKNELRVKLKKNALKFPFFYRRLHKFLKKIKKIDLNEEGVANEELKFLLENMGEDKIILEIGVFGGQTTKRFAKNNFVIGIDPFKGDLETGTLLGEYPEDVYLRFIKNVLGKGVILFPLLSKEAFNFWDKNIKRKIIDSIFIDGWHTYGGVEIDFKWCKYLKKEGIIAFHDANLEEVNKFIKERLLFNSEYKYLGSRGSIKIFKKII